MPRRCIPSRRTYDGIISAETAMDETFFPVLWTASGHRSPFIESYLTGGWGSA